MSMAAPIPLSVDVVSDVVCPWCYIGKKRLETALAAVPEVAAEVRWRPFQLDPTIPPGGIDRREYMLGKFGSDARISEIHARIRPLGAAEGITFDFEAIRRAPNTLDAHRVIRWAGSSGPTVQNALVERLFRLNFEEGADLGAAAVLSAAASQAGMDSAVVEALLPTDTDREAVRAEIETAQRMGVTGVPCFLLDGKYAVMGAQEPNVLADALRQLAAQKGATAPAASDPR
jgi:predicted DsbA family dithiol-disulfide isomerase